MECEYLWINMTRKLLTILGKIRLSKISRSESDNWQLKISKKVLKIDIFLKNHLHLCNGKELVPSISERLVYRNSCPKLNFKRSFLAQLQSYLQYGNCWLRSKVRGPTYQHRQQIFWTLIYLKYQQYIACFSRNKLWNFMNAKNLQKFIRCDLIPLEDLLGKSSVRFVVLQLVLSSSFLLLACPKRHSFLHYQLVGLK